MIPKIIRNKRQTKGLSGISKLISYISTKNIDQSESLSDECSFADNSAEKLVNYISRNASKILDIDTYFDDITLLEVDGISMIHNLDCEFNDVAISMQATAQKAVNCKSPIMHYVLSWQSQETPSDKEIFQSAIFTLKSLGMEEHQFIAGIHRDTDNTHVHIAVNRVNPRTTRVNICSYSQEILHKSCRLLELKYGFKHDAGAFIVNDNNQIVRNKNKDKRFPENAYKKERYTGNRSLYCYLENEKVTHFDGSKTSLKNELEYHINRSNSWDELHVIFAKAGLKIERSSHAKGLLISTNNLKNDAVKVSWGNVFSSECFNFSNLTNRLGSYKESTQDLHNIRQSLGVGYSPFLDIRDYDERTLDRIERLEDRLLLRGAYESYKLHLPMFKYDKEAFKEQINCINNHTRMLKSKVKSLYKNPLIRRQFYNVCEFEKYQKIALLRKAEKDKKNGFYADNPRLNYRQWVEQEAFTGNASALSQLRGWYYSQSKKEKHQNSILDKFGESRKTAINAIICKGRKDVSIQQSKSFSLRSSMLKDGSIIYENLENERPVLLDRGRIIFTRSSMDKNDILSAVALAFNGGTKEIKFVGNSDFVKSCTEYARLYKAHYEQFSDVLINGDVESQNMSAYVQKNEHEQLQKINNGVHLKHK
ncbi:TPA: TraI/MobA(P) family conjugative relaxase [Providencia stuartii]